MKCGENQNCELNQDENEDKHAANLAKYTPPTRSTDRGTSKSIIVGLFLPLYLETDTKAPLHIPSETSTMRLLGMVELD